jgi:FAD:protein FMN transferase
MMLWRTPRLNDHEGGGSMGGLPGFAEQVNSRFGTFVFQKVCGMEAEKIIAEADRRLSHYEEEFSFFREHSTVSDINRLAGVGFASISVDAVDLVREAIRMGELTGGLFDISIAPLVKMWAVNRPEARVVPLRELQSVLPLVNYRDILLDEERNAVMLKNPGQMIDLGGIAKGYITDRIIDLYASRGVSSALLNIGGNVKALGCNPDGEPWRVGVAYPDSHSTQSIGILNVKNRSVVTSGAYERGFLHNGKLYHHILDPRSGYPAETDLKSVTVVSPSSLEADAYSTPLFMMGAERAAAFAAEHQLVALFVTEKDEILITEQLAQQFSQHLQMKLVIM